MSRERITVWLPADTIKQADEVRGDASRSRWIERVLQQALGDADGHKAGLLRSPPDSSEGTTPASASAPKAATKTSVIEGKATVTASTVGMHPQGCGCIKCFRAARR